MKYFEGAIEYTHWFNGYGRRFKNRLYYKEGNYKLQEMPDILDHQRENKPVKIYPFGKSEMYWVKPHKGLIVTYQLDDFELYETEQIEMKEVGEEQVLGYDCIVIEVIEKRLQYYGEIEQWHFKQWIAKELPLNPKYRFEDIEFNSYEKFAQYAVALKYEAINEQGDIKNRATAQRVIMGEIDPKTFGLAAYQGLERISNIEQRHRNKQSRPERTQEKEDEDQKAIEQLKRMLGRELLPKEAHFPSYFIKSIPVAKVLAKTLDRALTEKEKDDPIVALYNMLECLPFQEQLAFEQRFLEYYKTD